MTTLDTPMECLPRGEYIVGPNGRSVYEVTGEVGSDPDYPEFLYVRNLDKPHRWDRHAGCYEDEGFFAYPLNMAMNLVIDGTVT